ncbi:MAG: carbohydrate-binding family 9-like protein [Acidobacteriaceae bacterium]
MILCSEFSETEWIPDGYLQKPAWTSAPKVTIDRDAFQGTSYPDLETTVASRWTGRFLYLAYWCKYKSLHMYQKENPRAERWELWDRDVIEAFINPHPSQTAHYYEFEVAPNNQWIDLEIDLNSKQPHDPAWNSGFEHATKVYPERHVWTVEMRIPVQSMGVQHVDPNTDWRINLYRADGLAKKRRLLSWSPLPIANNSFHQPASFGTLKFRGRGQ